MKLCSRLLIVLVEISARWKAHGQLSVRVNWTFFAIYYDSGVMRRNVYSSAVFTGADSLHSTFIWTGSSPSNHSWHRKLETLGYPMVKTASLCVPSFWHNTGMWRTDRRTDGFAVAYTALAASCKNWQRWCEDDERWQVIPQTRCGSDENDITNRIRRDRTV